MTATISPTAHLSFGGILASEWIKLRTLRSTVWCYAIMVALMIGVGVIIAIASGLFDGGKLPADVQRETIVRTLTFGVNFGQLVVAVLGALVITGEYGTGMIRSTLAAVPKRLPALVGKTVMFAVVTFVVAIVAMLVTAAISLPILAGRGVTVSVLDWRVLLPVLGAAGFLTLVGVMSLALGTIIRNSAGGIATTLGLLLVLPTVVSLLGAVLNASWLQNVATVLPSSAGSTMSQYVTTLEAPGISQGLLQLAPWEGGLVLFAWFAVFFVIAAVLLKRRDA